MPDTKSINRSKSLKMGKFFKYFAWILLILLVLVSAFGFWFSTTYKDQVTALVIEELNESIDAKIEIQSIDFSVFSHFPMASVTLEGVFVHSANYFLKYNPKKDSLLLAQKVVFEFNIWDLYNEKYILKHIQLEQAKAFILTDKKGRENFQILKKDTTNQPSQFQLKLSKITLDDVDFKLQNQQNKTHISLSTKKFIAAGKFSESSFDLSTHGSVHIDKLLLAGVRYPTYGNTSLSADLWVNPQQVSIKKGTLSLGEEDLSLKGTYQFDNEHINLNISSQKMTIENLLSNLPEPHQTQFEKYQANGYMAFTAIIDGAVNKSTIPQITVDASIHNAEMLNLNSDVKLTQLSFDLHYSTTEDALRISKFEGQINQSFAKADLILNNLLHPQFELKIDLQSDLTELQSFIELDTLQSLSGRIDAQLQIKGALASNKAITGQDVSRFIAHGQLQLTQAQWQYKGEIDQSIENVNAVLKISNNDLLIDSLRFKYGRSNIKILGKAYNTLAYALLPNESIALSGQLICDYIDLEEFLIPVPQSGDDKAAFSWPKNITANLDLNIGQLQKQKFDASQLHADFYLDPNGAKIENFRVLLAKGKAEGGMSIEPRPDKTYRIQLDSKLYKMDMSQLMDQFNNFGQNSITHQNLYGWLSSTTKMSAILDSNFKFNAYQTEIVSEIDILKGELKNYKPLYKLSKFIELSELEHIKFDRLYNILEFRNNTLFIPQMAIQSSAINMNVSGQHTFGEQYAYKMDLLLSEILGRKAKQNKPQNSEFAFVEDDGSGKTRLFLVIEGNANDMKIRYDSKSATQNLKDDLKEEKQTIKSLLNQEFGLFKKDTTLQKKKPEPVKSTKSQFQIEWEEQGE